MASSTILALIVILLIAALTWREQARHREAIRRQRHEMWDHCLRLFEEPELAQDDVNFPVLTGFYRNHRIKLEPIADHIAYRKLPQLWLCTTVFSKLPLDGTLDFLVRPENIEFYSHAWSLPVSVPIPESWPQHAMLRTDTAAHMPALDRISPHINMFDDPKFKELFITPNGVRIVYQLDQGQRAHYAVFRSLRFDALQVPPALIEMLLDRALSVIASLEAVEVH